MSIRSVLLFILGLAMILLASCGHTRRNPPTESALDVWRFRHVVVDAHPPATYRMNDVHVADFNGDGLPDIWTTGRGAGDRRYQMVWYKNPNWERFGIARGDFKYGNLGDIDGDGDIDIVVDHEWFENNGSPEQPDWPRHELGESIVPDLVHLAEINGDGRLDVVFTTKNDLYWLPNPPDPTGPWKLRHIYHDDVRRTGGTVGDIDHDGDIDVLWGNAWFENPGPVADSGDIGAPWAEHMIDSAWPAEARGAMADLNGDGYTDVVLTGEESAAGVAWYEGTATPTTGPWRKHVVVRSDHEGLHSLALQDFDGDGDLDIFTAEMHTGKDPDRVSIFENISIENDNWREHVIGNGGSHKAVVADLNGDGHPDVIGKNYEAGALPLQVDVWLSERVSPSRIDPSWVRHVIDSSRPWRAVFVYAGDVDGDKRPDIVTGAWWYQNPGSNDLEWQRRPVGKPFSNVAVIHDFDGDGDLDMLGTDGQTESSHFLWAENQGQGTFTLHEDIPDAVGDFLQGARVGHLGPPGETDVVLSWHNETTTQMYHVPSPPTGRWRWEVISPFTTGEQIALGDIDGDGDTDVHLGTAWLSHDETGWNVFPAVTLPDTAAGPDRVELADIDGDGDLDVVIGCEHAKCLVWGEAPANPRDPWLCHEISRDILSMSMDVGDVDGDGNLDVVVGEHNTVDSFKGRVMVFYNKGKGSAWAPDTVDVGLEHHDGTRLVDIDGDGDLDIVSIGWTHKWVVLYEHRPTQSGRSEHNGS